MNLAATAIGGSLSQKFLGPTVFFRVFYFAKAKVCIRLYYVNLHFTNQFEQQRKMHIRNRSIIKAWAMALLLT